MLNLNIVLLYNEITFNIASKGSIVKSMFIEHFSPFSTNAINLIPIVDSIPLTLRTILNPFENPF